MMLTPKAGLQLASIGEHIKHSSPSLGATSFSPSRLAHAGAGVDVGDVGSRSRSRSGSTSSNSSSASGGGGRWQQGRNASSHRHGALKPSPSPSINGKGGDSEDEELLRTSFVGSLPVDLDGSSDLYTRRRQDFVSSVTSSLSINQASVQVLPRTSGAALSHKVRQGSWERCGTQGAPA